MRKIRQICPSAGNDSQVESFDADEPVETGSGRKSKVLIGIVLLAIAGVAAFLLVPKKTSLGDAVKTAGLNVTSSGKLKLFDDQSK